MPENFTNDPSYQEWLAKTAAECWCCPECCDCPCGGCMAGGICDAHACRCDVEWDDVEDGEDEIHG